jgi:hypothetical protein
VARSTAIAGIEPFHLATIFGQSASSQATDPSRVARSSASGGRRPTELDVKKQKRISNSATGSPVVKPRLSTESRASQSPVHNGLGKERRSPSCGSWTRRNVPVPNSRNRTAPPTARYRPFRDATGQLPPFTALNEPSLKLPFVLCKSLRVALLNRRHAGLMIGTSLGDALTPL